MVGGGFTSQRVRVMVVDDCSTFRRMLCRVFESDPRLEVVTTAINGEVALLKMAHYRPDVVTLDLNMPVLDGLQVLEQLGGRRGSSADSAAERTRPSRSGRDDVRTRARSGGLRGEADEPFG